MDGNVSNIEYDDNNDDKDYVPYIEDDVDSDEEEHITKKKSHNKKTKEKTSQFFFFLQMTCLIQKMTKSLWQELETSFSKEPRAM